MTQLALTLQPRRVPARQLPIIERLRAVLTRSGINWRYRATSGSVLLRPFLAARCGWQPMCGYYCCGDFTFERVEGYCDRLPFDRDEREAWEAWKNTVYRPAIRELWGAP